MKTIKIEMRTAMLWILLPGSSFIGGCPGSSPAGSVDQAALTDLATPGDASGDLANRGGDNQTGGPCSSTNHCGGTNPVCIQVDGMGTVWPYGYCTSDCNPQRNDHFDRTNNACPGGNATCEGTGAQGRCLVLCAATPPPAFCAVVPGYACFTDVCLPSTLSECATGDGGCAPASADAGGDGKAQVCAATGGNGVGICRPACDVIEQNCASGSQCYFTVINHVAYCDAPPSEPGVDEGAPCGYVNGCKKGLICYFSGNQNGVCSAPCGGDKKVVCTGGKGCQTLFDRLGVCM